MKLSKVFWILMGFVGGAFFVLPILLYAANTFPTTLNNWIAGQTIPSNWANELEARIGITNSASTTSHDYRISHLESLSSSVTPSTSTIGSISYYNSVTTTAGTTTLPSGVQDNITRLGTIVSGVWQATKVALGFGGTGGTDADSARGSLGVASSSDVIFNSVRTASGTITTAKATNVTSTNLQVTGNFNAPTTGSSSVVKNGDWAYQSAGNMWIGYGSSSPWGFQPLVELPTKTILNVSSSKQYDIWRLPANFTLTGIFCGSDANNSSPLTFWRRTAGSSATTTLTTALPCNASDYSTSTFSNGGTAIAGQTIGVTIGTASGTPTTWFSATGKWTLQ